MNDKDLKEICAKEAVKYVKDGMTVGLGGGRYSALNRVYKRRQRH